MAEPPVVLIAQDFQAQLRAQSADTILYMSRKWTAVEASLSAEIEALAEELDTLRAAGQEVPAWKLYELERYQALLFQLGLEMGKYSQGAIGDLLDDGKKAQQLAHKHAQQMLGTASGPHGPSRLQLATDKLGAEATEKLASLARGGMPLQQILAKSYGAAANGITQQLLAGTALGINPREIARRTIKQGLAQGLNHVLLVARDQQIRNYREATRDVYKASGLVYGYMRLAAKNDRTCMSCLMLDGKIYDLGERMPLHPQDRCTIVPLIEGRPAPQFQTGKAWFEQQPEAVQKKMMGPKAWEWWKDGQIDLEHLVRIDNHPIWGDNAQVRTLKELRQIRGSGQATIQVKSADPQALQIAHLNAKLQAVPAPKAISLNGQAGTPAADLASDLDALLAGIPKMGLSEQTAQSLQEAVQSIKSGQEGKIYLDASGALSGAVTWGLQKHPAPPRLRVKRSAFLDQETMAKAMADLGAEAAPAGASIRSWVPTDQIQAYKDLGWQLDYLEPATGGARMSIGAAKVPEWSKDPQAYTAEALANAGKVAMADYLDPQAVAKFTTGDKLPGLPFEELGDLDQIDLDPLKLPALDFLPDLKLPPGRHAGAGMILIDEQTGKVIVTHPTGNYGGYDTTFPKGTQEPGQDLQSTAIREIMEETGLKPQIVGWLGDYEKTTSVNRVYIGLVKGGAPWAAGWESEAISYVPVDKLDQYLTKGGDAQIAADFAEAFQKVQDGASWADLASTKAEAQAIAQGRAQDALEAYQGGAEGLSISALQRAAQAAKTDAPELYGKIKDDIAQAQAAAKAHAEHEKTQADLLKAWQEQGPEALAGKGPQDLADLVAHAYNVKAPADQIADLEAVKAQLEEAAFMAKIVDLPADLQGATKSAKAAYLVDTIGAKAWQFKVVNSSQVDLMFGKSAGEILGELEAAGWDYWQNKKAAQAKAVAEAEPPPPPPDTVPAPEELETMTKNALIADLQAKTGAAKWKLKIQTVDQLKGLYDKPKAEALALTDQRATDANVGYKNAGKNKAAAAKAQAQAEAEPDKLTPPDTPFDQLTRKDLIQDLSVKLGLEAKLFAGISKYSLEVLYNGEPQKAAAVVKNIHADNVIGEMLVAWLDGQKDLSGYSSHELRLVQAATMPKSFGDQLAFKKAVDAALAAKASPSQKADPPLPAEPEGPPANQKVLGLVQTYKEQGLDKALQYPLSPFGVTTAQLQNVKGIVAANEAAYPEGTLNIINQLAIVKHLFNGGGAEFLAQAYTAKELAAAQYELAYAGYPDEAEIAKNATFDAAKLAQALEEPGAEEDLLAAQLDKAAGVYDKIQDEGYYAGTDDVTLEQLTGLIELVKNAPGSFPGDVLETLTGAHAIKYTASGVAWTPDSLADKYTEDELLISAQVAKADGQLWLAGKFTEAADLAADKQTAKIVADLPEDENQLQALKIQASQFANAFNKADNLGELLDLYSYDELDKLLAWSFSNPGYFDLQAHQALISLKDKASQIKPAPPPAPTPQTWTAKFEEEIFEYGQEFYYKEALKHLDTGGPQEILKKMYLHDLEAAIAYGINDSGFADANKIEILAGVWAYSKGYASDYPDVEKLPAIDPDDWTEEVPDKAVDAGDIPLMAEILDNLSKHGPADVLDNYSLSDFSVAFNVAKQAAQDADVQKALALLWANKAALTDATPDVTKAATTTDLQDQDLQEYAWADQVPYHKTNAGDWPTADEVLEVLKTVGPHAVLNEVHEFDLIVAINVLKETTKGSPDELAALGTVWAVKKGLALPEDLDNAQGVPATPKAVADEPSREGIWNKIEAELTKGTFYADIADKFTAKELLAAQKWVIDQGLGSSLEGDMEAILGNKVADDPPPLLASFQKAIDKGDAGSFTPKNIAAHWSLADVEEALDYLLLPNHGLHPGLGAVLPEAKILIEQGPAKVDPSSLITEGTSKGWNNLTAAEIAGNWSHAEISAAVDQLKSAGTSLSVLMKLEDAKHISFQQGGEPLKEPDLIKLGEAGNWSGWSKDYLIAQYTVDELQEAVDYFKANPGKYGALVPDHVAAALELAKIKGNEPALWQNVASDHAVQPWTAKGLAGTFDKAELEELAKYAEAAVPGTTLHKAIAAAIKLQDEGPETPPGFKPPAPGKFPPPAGITSLAMAQGLKKIQLQEHLAPLMGKKTSTLKAYTVKQMLEMIDFDADPQAKAGTPPKAAIPAEAIPKSGTFDITGAKADLVQDLKKKAAADLAVQPAALKHLDKVLDNVANGHTVHVYKDANGTIIGMASFQDLGQHIKMTGKAFVNNETLKIAVGDGIKLAEQAGKPFYTWISGHEKASYQAWGGFVKVDSDYHQIDPKTAPPHYKEGASQSKTVQQDKGPLPFPAGVTSQAEAAELPKTVLVKHLAAELGYTQKELGLLDKGQLVEVLGTYPGDSLKEAIQLAKDKEIHTTVVDGYQVGGLGSLATSKQVNGVIQAHKALGIQLAKEEAAALTARFEELREEERLNSPYVPVYEPRPMPALPKEAQIPRPADFPKDPLKLKDLGGAGGTTGARIVQDPATGKRYIMKRGASQGHLRAEASADAIYEAAGLRVPKFTIYETPQGPVKLAEFVEGSQPLDKALRSATPAVKAKIQQQLRAGFAVDALLENYDVIGHDQDNVLVDKEGNVYRVDNGGSFRYQAMGGQDKTWDEWPLGLWTMREGGRAGAAKHNETLFGSMSIYEVLDQVPAIAKAADAILAATPPAEREILHARIENMREYHARSLAVRRDTWRAEYTDQWIRSSAEIGRAGFVKRLPTKMTQKNKGSVHIKDQDGALFDDLRGGGSTTRKIGEWINQQTNSRATSTISTWMSQQGHDSWQPDPQAVKWLMNDIRGGDPHEHYWHKGAGTAKRNYERMARDPAFVKTFAYWHAYTYELMRRTDFPRNIRDRGYVEVGRTESNSSVIKNYGIKQGFNHGPQRCLRGAMESGSLYTTVVVNGDRLVLQRVPHHRIMGIYFTERPDGSSSSAFLGDTENELLFDTGGLDFYYLRQVNRGMNLDQFWDELYREVPEWDPNK